MGTDALVTCSTDAGIAVITIASPPVNALAHPVRARLLELVVAADEAPDVRAIVIRGSGRHFVAGADIREFDAPPRAPLLNDVLLRVEACGKPVVAAIHGSALGGGCELALASHYRLAAAEAQLGLPEVKLGLLPGAGGTQRLPRLIGAKAALDLTLSGAPVGAGRALELGLVDRVVAADELESAAIGLARQVLADGLAGRRTCDRVADPSGADADFFASQRRQLGKTHPGLLSPGYIVECVEASLRLPFAEALALSRRRFEECRESRASRALRHLFFAERPRADGPEVAVRPVRTVAVIGAGTMGSGIAISLALAGYAVSLVDPNEPARVAGIARVRATIEGSVAKGRLGAADGAAAIARVTAGAELAATAGADLVIEAVFEKLSVKQAVFRELDGLCAADTILATNTSTLDIDAIASVTSRPSMVLGMHFFSPANIMKLVEVVRGRATDPSALATALAVTKRMGKLGIVVGNCFGFVGNRMLYAYGRESQFMLLEGATPAAIDRALRTFGMAMGPNAVGDLAGLDVGYNVRRERTDRPSDPRWFRVFDALVEAGRLGQKTGKGVYRYEPGAREPLPDLEVDALIIAEAARLGVARREIGDEEIVNRCIHALINEGAHLLGESIAARAADIDAIWCNGYGFPRYRGGPMFHADTLGLAEVVRTLERYAREHGAEWWQPAPLLQQLAAAGSTFADFDAGRGR